MKRDEIILDGALPTNKLPAPCSVCRRAMAACICTSHVPMAASDLDAPSVEEDAERIESMSRLVRGGPVLDAVTIRARCDEAMRRYYSRDAIGLQRLVRSWFS